jgi:phosphoglycolate phosphatase
MTPPPGVTLLNPALPRGDFRAAMFDFDGTLSLLREGWYRVMAELGRDALDDQKLPRPPDEELLPAIEADVLRLSGKPTILQMRRLADEVAQSGGTRPDPDELDREFYRRLMARVGHRKQLVRDGQPWTPRGTHELLRNLKRRGVALYLASGTVVTDVREEADLLMVDHFFGDRFYAPAPGQDDYTKRAVVETILREQGITGRQLLGFGDGYSETVEVKRVGGVTVGIATEEPPKTGLHPTKAAMLEELGADLLVADFSMQEKLVEWLFAC